MARNAYEVGFWARGFARLKFKLFPSYADYVAERDRLKALVMYWQYPDGSFVRQSKRLRLMMELREINRIIDAHPDNPKPQDSMGGADTGD